jgi:ferritin
MKISSVMESVINRQIQEEFESAYLYLSMSAWFESLNLSGFARWMRIQYQEELSHGLKMFDYLFERDGTASVPAIKQSLSSWDSPLAAFEAAYAHEQHITACIYDIVVKARSEGDLGTESFYSYFVKEQVEEEANALSIVNKLKMLSSSSNGIYLLDKEMGSRSDD